MTDISSNYLNAHYTTQTKVEKPVYSVASAPQSLPSYHAFNDIDANNKFSKINENIYDNMTEEKEKSKNNFWKYYLGFVVAVLSVIGLKRLFK